MVRILAISDLHENMEMLKRIIENTTFDIIFFVGDISELRILDFYNILKNIEQEVLVINGNHDCVPCLRRLAKKLDNVNYVSRGISSIEIDNEEFLVAAISGIYRRKNADGILYFDDKILLNFYREIKDYGSVDFVLSHTPPYRRADFLPKGGRGGLKAFLVCEDICDPDYWISGHTHVLAVERSNDMYAINCGLGYIGDFVLINTKQRTILVGRLIHNDLEISDIDEDANWDYIYYLRRTKSFKKIMRQLASKI